MASSDGRGEARTDRILSIEFAGPVTAIAKVFHYDLGE